MDEFAQSREDDDLFADEFEPVSTPTAVVEPAPAPQVQPPQQNAQQQNAGRGKRESGRGRGRGREPAQQGLASSRFASKPEPPQAQQPPAPVATAPEEPAAENSPVDTPAPATTGRTLAVRGDRSLTGGPSKKKLTEEELSAKMEKMAILNAQKSEKHRLTELDQAQFQDREAELAKERKEKEVKERRERGQMEAERRANRERKMKGMGGREWDLGKEEMMAEEAKRGRSSEYVRGGHGGVKRGGLAGSRFADSTDDSSAPVTESPRGRGAFNIRGRGNRGRGARSQPMIPAKDEDFPSLPTPAKAQPPKLVPAAESGYSDKSKAELGKDKHHDWAEEMATPVEEKKLNLEGK